MQRWQSLELFEEKGCSTVGIEPTDAAKDSRHVTIQKYFNKQSANEVLERFGSPDYITFTNVFAHISNLDELLESLKILISKKTILVIENHYLGTILKTEQFDTFYHEHPRTYSHKSFTFIAESLGLKLMDAQYVSRYGGNIRAYIGDGEEKSSPGSDETLFLEQFYDLNLKIKSWIKSTEAWLNDYVEKNGKIKAKAFPGRAAILIKMLNLNEEHISEVYEIKGSIKVGHYVPGTKIPILPEKELYQLENQKEPILNLAWHLPGEVRSNLTINGYEGKVIDIKPMNAG